MGAPPRMRAHSMETTRDLHVPARILKKSCFGRGVPRFNNFYKFLKVLFVSLPYGFVLNANAGRGVETCVLAELGEPRRVRAVESHPKLIRSIAQFTRRRPNIRIRRGVLGAVSRNLTSAELWHGYASRSYTLDQLAGPNGKWYEEGSTPLVFALLTANGSELDILRGGAAVIARDRPIIATRSRKSRDAIATYMFHLNYRGYVVRETNLSYETRVYLPPGTALPSRAQEYVLDL
jgi:hypothetical protein